VDLSHGVIVKTSLGERQMHRLVLREVAPVSVRLTSREREILALVADGMTSREIADQIFLSKRTVDYHLANAFEKLNVTNRLAACRRAMDLGLIAFEPSFAYVS
jgi:DNA-binding CsgD family transcriptional regulator